ncbi:uncharacterized protein LOC114543773 [Dendronephthya gigantea]|uniref:uncharacterized protein LOC114543773 n=1 Tax=Dendronephthya gigantea TaxID=151771 RepID=UPI00106CAD4E|nr:uncharacterized protein LOC114543773 [Dendronephthya gigantea]XP_028418425.1 uncharacterized protein LOC114543773 [Dendronephthya gigantea]XP_028418426.1 uncharacterized protein LOC114543773 [Dendronephthya gigantea]XP_028418427.1 uncharacterized protein LOC114543773 [Dendronephthya gigantea]XP_028418428.1 uncharacterized protein LOC114543773 [Dendronephthya gigantea]
MVSVRIFYCWSISLLALMVQSSNDELSNLEPNKTLKRQDNQSIKSESIFPPSATVNTKDPQCALLMNESGITEVIKLVQHELVNIVDLSFSTSSNNRLLANKQIAIVKPIGEQILYALDINDYNYAMWSLNVGRRSYNLNVREDPEECLGDSYDYVVANTFKRIVLRMKPNPTNYKICYLQRTNLWESRQICCHITKPDPTNFEYRCPEIQSHHGTYNFLWVIAIFGTGLLPVIFLIFLYSFLSHSVFDEKYPQYRKLQESPMSLSSILFKFFWSERGGIVTFIRKIALISALLCIIHRSYRSNLLNIIVLLPMIAYHALVISSLVAYRIRNKRNKEFIEILQDEGFVGGVPFLNHLPFNVKSWRRNVRDVENFIFTIPNKFVRPTVKTIPKSVALYACYSLKVVLFVFFFLLAPAIIYFYAILFLTPHLIMQILEFEYTYHRDKYFYPSHCEMFDVLCAVLLLTFTSYSYYILVLASQSFLLGLFLNIAYFAPYAAPLAVTAFYCCTCWKSVERKYYYLEQLIYEECGKEEINNNSNQRLQQNERLLPVVSKELYENIREKLLPYDTNLTWLGLKIGLLLGYLYFILMVLDMLHEHNFTIPAQMWTMISVSIIPFIFNTLALKVSGGEGKEPWIRVLELNVKEMVPKQTDGTRSRLARRALVVKESSSNTVSGDVVDSQIHE